MLIAARVAAEEGLPWVGCVGCGLAVVIDMGGILSGRQMEFAELDFDPSRPGEVYVSDVRPPKREAPGRVVPSWLGRH